MILTVCFCCKRCVCLNSATLLFIHVSEIDRLLKHFLNHIDGPRSERRVFLLEHEYIYTFLVPVQVYTEICFCMFVPHSALRSRRVIQICKNEKGGRTDADF